MKIFLRRRLPIWGTMSRSVVKNHMNGVAFISVRLRRMFISGLMMEALLMRRG